MIIISTDVPEGVTYSCLLMEVHNIINEMFSKYQITGNIGVREQNKWHHGI